MVLFKRGLHTLGVVVAVLLLGLIGFFVVGSLAIRSAIPSEVIGWAAWVIPGMQLVAAVFAIRGKVSYRILVPVTGVSAACIVYLVIDDRTLPPPIDIPSLSEADADAYRAYRWYLKDAPDSRVAEMPSSLFDLPPLPKDREQWSDYMEEHREIILEAWASDELGRTWVEIMAKRAPASMFPVELVDEPMLNYSAVHASANVRWAYAGLLAWEGRADEAADVLLHGLRAFYHLQRGGPSLVVDMIGVVCARRTYQWLEQLLDENRLSPNTRAAIAQALAEAPSVSLIVRNSFTGEEALAFSYFRQLRAEDELGQFPGSHHPLMENRLLQPLFFNRTRTEWEYQAFIRETSRLAQERRLTGVEGEATRKAYQRGIKSWRMKNVVGQLFVQKAAPAFLQVTDVFWQVEDERRVLLGRVTQ
jgi:hypothetical protein